MVFDLPQAVVELMAQRAWRMHHYVWHNVRNGWHFFPESTRAALRALGWEPPRPALRLAAGGGRRPIYDNHSGEDFLYMHRGMIAAVNAKLTEVGDPNYQRVEPWSEVPRPESQDFPVPPAWDSGNASLNEALQRSKSSENFETMLQWERDLKDPARLRNMSLGELGARIEFTIHNQMHMRWCSNPSDTGIRPDVDDARPDAIDGRWDAPAYDWLGDTYSSHVHSTFWKLHGWVDDRIEDWKGANGIAGDIPWRGTWIGKMPGPAPGPSLRVVSTLLGRLTLKQAPFAAASLHDHDHGHGHDHGDVAALTAAVKEVLRSGVICHFYDPVEVE
jgi:hypothetical protein